MTDQRNLLVAILLSIVILLGFQYFYEIPRMEQRKAERQASESAAKEFSNASCAVSSGS